MKRQKSRNTEKAGNSEARPLGASAFPAFLLFGLFCFLPSCGPRNFENENDRLRAEVLQLERRIDELEGALQRREGQLAAARQRLDEGVSPVEGAEPPRLAQIELDRYTGAFDTDRDGGDDVVRAYVRPVDQRGRMIPVAGRATLQVVVVRPDQEPSVIAQERYGPEEFEAAYRSGFTGTHYTLEAELPEPLPDGVQEATLVVTLTEAATGADFSAQKAVRLRHAPPAAAE